MSEKLRRLREAIENASPDLAAEAAARRFEERSVPLPECLIAPGGAPAWEARRTRDAGRLYRNLVIDGGEQGLTLTELHASAMGLGQGRRSEAIRFLRSTDAVAESRRGTDGFDLDRIILRAAQ